MVRETVRLCFLALALGAGVGGVAVAAGAPPQRIVSLTPVITETLFALGAGDQVVGVTRFCNYPPEAQKRAIVGGIIDMDVEAVLTLRPDLVIGEQEQAVLGNLHRLGLNVLAVECQNLQELLAAFTTIGQEVGRKAEAQTLVASIRGHCSQVAEALKEEPRPRVLVVVGRNPLVAAGRGTFLDELISLAAATNTVGDSERPYPTVSMETVLLRQPEVIVECSGSMVGKDLTEEARQAWSRWPTLAAVRSGRVFVSKSDALLRPGPRVVEALDELVRYFHPDVARARPQAGARAPTPAGR
jgi:iron complex transport system substrate-binding protein